MSSGRHGFIPSSAEDALRQRVKAELRKRMRGLRNVLPPASSAERSARIVERLLALPTVSAAKSIALFWLMEQRREVDLRPLDAELRSRGVRIAYPAVQPDARALKFHFATRLESMKEMDSGLHEPAASEPEAVAGELEVIVVPALAMDSSGHRIGYGGGYYDATLPRFAPPAATVVVAFDFQLVAEVPATKDDVSVDWVVTDKRDFATTKGA